MKITKRSSTQRLSVTLVLIMILSLLPVAVLAAVPSDIEDHWAKDTITEWVKDGKANGYEDGTFRPENPITRAEFMVLVNNSFGFIEAAEIDFTDVPSDAWYADDVAKAKAAGYISGYPDGTVKPGVGISRQEVAVVVANLKDLGDNAEAAGKFDDADLVPDWSKGAIGAVVEAGYMSGYPDNTFKPVDNIKRAEALKALDNALATVVYDVAGVYGPEEGEEEIDADVIINEDGVLLQNVLITGDLTIGEGVGEGTVTLNNVTVKGDTFVWGGGTNSIVINGGSYNRIIVRQTSSGAVRIVAVDAKGIEVVLAEDSADRKVVLEGVFESVTVDAPDIELRTQGETTIKEILVTEKSEGIVVHLDKGTIVDKVVKELETEIKGDGKVKETVAPEKEEEPPKKNTGGGSSKPSVKIESKVGTVYGEGHDALGDGLDLTGVLDDAEIKSIELEIEFKDEDLDITGLEITGISGGGNGAHRFFEGIEGVLKGFEPKLGELEGGKVTITVTVAELFEKYIEKYSNEEYNAEDKKTVKLGSLRAIFGEIVEIKGKISATGYSATAFSETIILGPREAAD